LEVDGLRRGLYHYAPERHELDIMGRGNYSPRMEEYCAGQWWVGTASAVFLMTAVLERTMWRYGSARALRTIYMEAGHLCQTFCLTATALHLAPFCTAALKDTTIERDLGLDGISESVLYASAVGHPMSRPFPKPGRYTLAR
jgi:SagB-type dehydrogenase family enzyme